MKIKTFLFLVSVTMLLTVMYNCSQKPQAEQVSELDTKLTELLSKHNFTGKMEEQLEKKLGRKIDARKVNLGKLIFFDKGLAHHQDNSCSGCHAPTNGFGDSQAMAIGIENDDTVGVGRSGPRNQRRSPMLVNVGFFPALMWNGRFSSKSNDPFDNSKGFDFPAPELDTTFKASDDRFKHLLVAQAHIPFTEFPEMAGFRHLPDKFNMSRFQGFLIHLNQDLGTPESFNKKGNKSTLSPKQFIFEKGTQQGDSCESYPPKIFSDDDTGFPLPPFENGFANFPIRRETIKLINSMPEYKRLFAEIYPVSKPRI